MMDFYVSGQSLKFYSPAVAADSLNYLTARVNFTDSDWDGASKWLHFRGSEELYDIQLDENDCITADKKLNLSLGQWEVYLTGVRGESRLTTVPVILTVYASGLVDAPLHELPLSVAEQVDYNARQALMLARSLKEQADSGAFNGADGTSLAPIGHFNSPDELAAIITQPNPGDVYSVGEARPYELYVWDSVNLIWRNHGQLPGVPGEAGQPGATYIPSVDANGNLSWSNDAGLDNPGMVNIMGPAGQKGDKGNDGAGAFDKAKEAGYTGTEATFYSALSYMPYHNARHRSDGPDPITVDSAEIKDGAVTLAKLASDARSRGLSVNLPLSGWVNKSQTLSVSGISAQSNIVVSASAASRAAYNDAGVYCSSQGEGTLTFSCETTPEAELTANVIILV